MYLKTKTWNIKPILVWHFYPSCITCLKINTTWYVVIIVATEVLLERKNFGSFQLWQIRQYLSLLKHPQFHQICSHAHMFLLFLEGNYLFLTPTSKAFNFLVAQTWQSFTSIQPHWKVKPFKLMKNTFVSLSDTFGFNGQALPGLGDWKIGDKQSNEKQEVCGRGANEVKWNRKMRKQRQKKGKIWGD